MKIQTKSILIGVPLIAIFWAVAANASSVIPGIAVGSPGDDEFDQVGIIGSVPNIDGAIKYYIPLNGPDSEFAGDYTGVYGVSGTSPCSLGAGTCSDYGRGTGYGTVADPKADALKMNIFFDLSGEPDSQSASLSFIFDDLDLTPDNDPDSFYESISLSYWQSTGPGTFNLTPIEIRSAMTDESQLPNTDLFNDANLITWDLSLASLGDLNASKDNADGFWIQLGFGSDFSGYKGRNTPEYLAASLTVSPVPIPATFWLFGTALLGFIGFSRRTTI